MKSRRIIKQELIEVAIPAGTTLTEFPIPEQNNLRNVELLGIQVFVNEIIPFSAISQKAVLTQAYMQKCFITLLNYGGFAFVHLAPILMFQTMEYETFTIANSASGGSEGEGGSAASSAVETSVIFDRDIKDFSRQCVNWPQCKLKFSASIAALGTDSVVLIAVYYYDPESPADNDTIFAKMH